MAMAYLSNYDNYTTFTYGDRTITFLTSKRLRRYTSIKLWDKGYIVVDCAYEDNTSSEDYIDLIPILKNLYFDPDVFLKDIEGVQLRYE